MRTKQSHLLHGDARPVRKVSQRGRAISTQVLSQESALRFSRRNVLRLQLRQPLVHAEENDLVALALSVTDLSFRHRNANHAPAGLHPGARALAHFGANGSSDV